jgi:hypothetical protein
MSRSIRIVIGDNEVRAALNESQTAKALQELLPLEISMSRWGDEYYGDCGLSAPLEPEARAEMEVGELAYWPQGSALCIFFGPTPASVGEEPRAVSPVNPLGMIEGDVGFLKSLPAGVSVRVESSD